MAASEAFEPVRSALEQAGVRYAIGGSWASTAVGEPRFTNDIDILAEFTTHNLDAFLRLLPGSFYVDADEAMQAMRFGRPFNVIHTPSLLKFDFFPADAFPLGAEELKRAVPLTNRALSDAPVPFVTAEDILLVKLHWYRLGGEVAEVQWRDVRGILLASAGALDSTYLERGAAKLGVSDLLDRALKEPAANPS